MLVDRVRTLELDADAELYTGLDADLQLPTRHQ
jgi:hypothetical protein